MHRQVFNHLQLFRADAMKAYADCVENVRRGLCVVAQGGFLEFEGGVDAAVPGDI